MDTSQGEGKKLLIKLEGAVEGTEVELGLPSLMPRWTKEPISTVLIQKSSKLWVFHMMWFGISMGDFSVEQRGTKLLFEELG